MADETISATDLRLMTEVDWTRVMAAEPAVVARYVRSAAEHGFKAAQVVWGQMLLDGTGVARDRAGAFRWFGRAASIGSPDGMNMVGRCHELGWGVPADHAEAARWYRKAAAKGSAWGGYNLGCMILYGDGIDHDEAEALRWFEKSADAGNVKAMGMLARHHEEGWGVPRDPAKAASWYRLAAEGGDCWAQYNLALLHLDADDVPAAAAWLRRSLDSGTPNYWLAAGRELSGHDHPALQAIGREATGRAAATRGGGEPAPQAGLWARLRRLARPLPRPREGGSPGAPP